MVCLPKSQGGLGVIDLKVMNLALLGKWLWRLENGSGHWQDIIRMKYLNNKTLSQVTAKAGDSFFWKGVLEVKDAFFSCCKRVLGDGSRIRFWEDLWIGDVSFAVKYARLYNLEIGRAHV